MDEGSEVQFTYKSVADETDVTIAGTVESITGDIAVMVEHAAYSVWGHSNACAGRRHVIDVDRLEEKRLAPYARDVRKRRNKGVELHSLQEQAANIRDELMAPAHPGG